MKEVRPKLIVPPVYPPAARKHGGRETVTVGALVDARGFVTGTFIVKSDAASDIRQAAQSAIKQWRFPVLKEEEEAIAYVVFVPVVMKPE